MRSKAEEGGRHLDRGLARPLNRGVGLSLVAALLAACATQPPPQYATLTVPDDYVFAATIEESEPFPESSWWQRFGSENLDQLIARAEVNNPDLSAAAARIARADAELRRSGASQLPRLGADGSASRTSRPRADEFQDGGGSRFSAGLLASYELDLWGATSGAVEAAAARALASRYEQEAVALSLFSEVALGYIALLGLNEQLEAASRSLELAREVQALTRTRERAGAASGLETAQQRSVIAGLEARLSDLQRQAAARRLALSILLGDTPNVGLLPEDRLLELRLPLPAPGLPADLLRRRPDLRAAEAGLRAAAADVEVARAALFPSISLSAGGTSASDALRSLVDPASVLFTVTAGLAQTVFDGGARLAAIESNEAQQVALLEGYRSSVLTALQEVEVALSEAAYQEEVEASRLDALEAAREAYGIAEVQFRTGAVDFLNLLEAQRSLIDAETQAILARQARLEAAVSLYRALGGGYDPATPGASLAALRSR